MRAATSGAAVPVGAGGGRHRRGHGGSRRSGCHDLITIDVGGTSSDIALIEGGEPVIRPQGMIAGYPVRVPMVDVNAIGAGGGSIAWLDAAGGLRVGPHSAGSDPGPACYGTRRRTQPTVTDASVVLGWLDPAYFAGGALRLDPARAREAIERVIARPLGLGVEEAALGIHRVVECADGGGYSSGVHAARTRSAAFRAGCAGRRGADCTRTALAAELDIGTVLIPRHPGVLSAAGLLAAPVEHEVAAAFPRTAGGAGRWRSAPRARRTGCALRRVDGGRARAGCRCRCSISPICGMSGSRTIWTCRSTLDAPDPIAALYRAFLALHERIYGHSTESPAAIVNLRACIAPVASERGKQTTARAPATRAKATEHPRGRRCRVRSDTDILDAQRMMPPACSSPVRR